jgi:hypothetical protein
MEFIRISSADVSSGGALLSPSTGGAENSGVGTGRICILLQDERKSVEAMINFIVCMVFIPAGKFPNTILEIQN